jgi:hypothetical protein
MAVAARPGDDAAAARSCHEQDNIAKADELPVFITARGRKIRNSEPGGGCFQWAPTPNPLPRGEGGGRYCHNIALCSGHCIDIDICDTV